MHRLARAHGPRLRFLHVLKELCPRGHETRWETAYDRLADGGKTRRFCGPSRWARMGEIHAGFERRTWKIYLDAKGEVWACGGRSKRIRMRMRRLPELHVPKARHTWRHWLRRVVEEFGGNPALPALTAGPEMGREHEVAQSGIGHGPCGR